MSRNQRVKLIDPKWRLQNFGSLGLLGASQPNIETEEVKYLQEN